MKTLMIVICGYPPAGGIERKEDRIASGGISLLTGLVARMHSVYFTRTHSIRNFRFPPKVIRSSTQPFSSGARR
jgi:hypothetical protein